MQIENATQTAEPMKVRALNKMAFVLAAASIGAFCAPIYGLIKLMSNKEKER